MSKGVRVKEKGRFPALILFLAGFLAGTILPNVLWRLQWQQQTMASIYILGAFADKSITGKDYLKEILRVRGSYYLLSVICGISIFGVPLAVLGMLFLGGETGALLAMSVLEFGFTGGVVGAGLLLPQYLVYIPVTMLLMTLVYHQSLQVWQNHGLYPERTGKYMLKCAGGAVLYGLGILLEWKINPWVAEKVLGMIKIF